MLDRLIQSFELYYPAIACNAVDYKIGLDNLELVVSLSDDTEILYDDLDNTIRNLPQDVHDMSDEEYKREFGCRLDKIIRRRGITQNDLCEMTGISPVMMSRYKNGVSTPSFYLVIKIADALDCSLDDLRYRR